MLGAAFRTSERFRVLLSILPAVDNLVSLELYKVLQGVCQRQQVRKCLG